jgi:hypothetical protein
LQSVLPASLSIEQAGTGVMPVFHNCTVHTWTLVLARPDLSPALFDSLITISVDTILNLLNLASSLSVPVFGGAWICPRRLQPLDEVIVSQRSAYALVPPKRFGLGDKDQMHMIRHKALCPRGYRQRQHHSAMSST